MMQIKCTIGEDKQYNQYKNLFFYERNIELHLVWKVTVMQ